MWTLLLAMSAHAAELDLTATPAVRGEPFTLSVSLPVPSSGVMVYLTLSTRGLGAGPCPPQLAGRCLDVRRPVVLAPVSSVNDVASWTLTTPPNAPPTVWAQAAATYQGLVGLSDPIVLVVTDLDTDGDGLSDPDEAQLGTDPDLPDTDGDSLSDGEEVWVTMTDPLSADTDNDGLDDGLELDAGTDPLLDDTDLDGVLDGAEVSMGTDPLNADTDLDGVPDGLEVSMGTDPLNADTDFDGVPDGADPAPLARPYGSGAYGAGPYG